MRSTRAIHDVVSGGRTLRTFVSGATDGDVLVFHTGTPSPPVQWKLLDDIATQRGLSVVTYCRPGYGRSDRQHGRRVADAADDVGAILDALGVDSFATLGWSGGGQHALACAAMLPKRCRAAATIGSLSPLPPGDNEWWAEMSPSNDEAFRAALAGEARLCEHLEPGRQRFLTVSGEELTATLGDLMSATDQQALTPGLADMLARSRRQAAASGFDGWVDDLLAFVGPWGFELNSIARPVTIWHGRDDRFVPSLHARRIAEEVPSSTLQILHEEGHLSIATARIDEVLDDLT